ncbi:MAG: hypothetical protein O7C59_12245 [Rickettsia endosymbiont of Ixodes persulcatus]|nr:hypothetical protein [Rickettsia endosymbiont of Ixodes persulcatus]
MNMDLRVDGCVGKIVGCRIWGFGESLFCEYGFCESLFWGFGESLFCEYGFCESLFWGFGDVCSWVYWVEILWGLIAEELCLFFFYIINEEIYRVTLEKSDGSFFEGGVYLVGAMSFIFETSTCGWKVKHFPCIKKNEKEGCVCI